MILESQNLILKLSPGVLPLFAIPLSLIQSWHCFTMCAPIYSARDKSGKLAYLKGRLISYTAVGALFGAFGNQLQQALEVKVLGALAFLIFFALSVSLALHWFYQFKKKTSFFSISSAHLQKLTKNSSFLQGLLSVALPCGLLYQIFGISVLSRSAIAGGLIGLGHATVSTLGLWAGAKFVNKFITYQKTYQNLLRAGILIVIMINIFYFAGILFYSEEVAKSKVLFCF